MVVRMDDLVVNGTVYTNMIICNQRNGLGSTTLPSKSSVKLSTVPVCDLRQLHYRRRINFVSVKKLVRCKIEISQFQKSISQLRLFDWWVIQFQHA